MASHAYYASDVHMRIMLAMYTVYMDYVSQVYTIKAASYINMIHTRAEMLTIYIMHMQNHS